MDLFSANQLLDRLSGSERERITPFLEPVDLHPKMTLCTAGEPISHAVFPHNAVTSTLMELPEGDAVEVGLMGSEAFVGLDLVYGTRVSLTSVVVQVSGTGTRIRADDFVREMVQPGGEFYHALLRYSRAFLGMVAQSGACNATHLLEQRLARWLLMVHDRADRDRFDLTHEFIALMLGVRRAGVSGAANSLRVAGAIEYTRGEIVVKDREILEKCSCGCYEIIRSLSATV